jgi:hypothetical protein
MDRHSRTAVLVNPQEWRYREYLSTSSIPILTREV